MPEDERTMAAAGGRRDELLKAHWFCVVPLLPLIGMVAIHKALGLSDALLGIPEGERPPTAAESLYNCAMVTAFFAGVLGFFTFAAARAVVDLQVAAQSSHRVGARLLDASRGLLWFVAKLSLLGFSWYALLHVL